MTGIAPQRIGLGISQDMCFSPSVLGALRVLFWGCFAGEPRVDRWSVVLNLPLISFVEQNVGDMFPSVHSGPVHSGQVGSV